MTIVPDILTSKTYENMLSKWLKESKLIRSFHAVNYVFVPILLDNILRVFGRNRG